MKTVKLSTLPLDTIVLVDGDSTVTTVEDVIEYPDEYSGREIYTTKPYYASFNADELIESAIEQEYNNGMYEDWDERIRADVTQEDIDDIQKIFDRILSRNPHLNISYEAHQTIEKDLI